MVKLNKTAIEFLNSVYVEILKKYYETLSINSIKEIIEIINGNSNLSLRLIDWVITKYSKNSLFLIQTETKDIINVYISYKSQLKNYTKKFFDPFKRGIIIDFKFNDELSIKTTTGQLLFFKWMYENDIISYIFKNRESLYNKMYIYYVNEKKNKILNNNKKKEENKQIKRSNNIVRSFTFTLN